MSDGIDYARNWREPDFEGYTTFIADEYGVRVNKYYCRRIKSEKGRANGQGVGFDLPVEQLYYAWTLGQ